MEQRENIYITLLKNACVIISLGLFLYILFAHALRLFSPDQIHTDPKAFNYLYLKFIVTVSFVVGGLGIILSRFEQPSSVPHQSRFGSREKVAFAVTSLFFAYFYIGQSAAFTFSLKILFTGLAIFFYIFLPRLINLYTTVDFSKIHRLKPHMQKEENGMRILSRFFTIFIATITVIFSGILMFNIAIGYINGNVERDHENMKMLYIASVEPQKTTLAEKVVVHGYNFGWNVDGKSKLMSSDGQIVTSLWQHDIIHFTVPLHMKTGERELWVVKPVHENRVDSLMVQSNRIPLSIVPRESFFPEINYNKLVRLIKKIKRFVLFNMQNVGKYLF